MFFIDSCRLFFFFFKQKTAYEMRISDWSSDVCSSDLRLTQRLDARIRVFGFQRIFGVGQAVVPAGKPRVFIDHRRQPFRRLRIGAFPQRANGARRADDRKIIDLVVRRDLDTRLRNPYATTDAPAPPSPPSAHPWAQG